MRVLVVGGTGNVGKLVLQQLLDRDIKVRAIVRSPDSLAATLASNPKLCLIKASLLDLSEDELIAHVKGCDAVISTLGHNLNYAGVPFLGIWAPPHDLVLRASKMICCAIEKIRPATPIKFILLNTVGVENPVGTDTHVRSRFEKTVVSLLKTLIPPYTDNVLSAGYISKEIKTGHPYIEWTVVRPDSFIDGDISEYTLSESIRHPFYIPDRTTKANIAHFMCELVVNLETWSKWRFKMPVIFDANQ
ncbi:uncharacterized protein VTP21DRAFT_2569 [Calcarisporiella thermophila]|uniref:uncharacterized protein n=1 Tax=Calcarisporiella thermophila TaxID=911321 RepID=UPI003743FB67